MRDDFAVFILSHGRSYNVLTVNTLIKYGYTGKWYIIIDNEDDQADAYFCKYGKEHVIMFDKEKFMQMINAGATRIGTSSGIEIVK